MSKIGIIALIMLVICITVLFIGCMILRSDAKHEKIKKREKAENVDPVAVGVIMPADAAKITAETSLCAPNEEREKAWQEIQSRIQKASEEGHTYIQVSDGLYSKIPYAMLISTLETLGYVAEAMTSNEFFPEDYYKKGYQLYIRWDEKREWR